VTIGTCGLPGAILPDGSDTYLRLYAPDNATQIAFSDDSCATLGSNLTVLVPTTGTYYLHAGCYDDTACNATVAIRAEPMPPPIGR